MRIDLCGTSVSSITHDCEAQTLVLCLSEWRGPLAADASVSGAAECVLFEGVAAYHFEHAMSTNLLEGVHEMDAVEFVREYGFEFPTVRSPWPELPTLPETIDALGDAIREAGLHVYVLESAWGLEGWAMARSVSRVDADSARCATPGAPEPVLPGGTA